MDTLKKLTAFVNGRNIVLLYTIPLMANRNLGKKSVSLTNRTVVQTPNATLNGCLIQKRNYKPYTILPKKYRIVKDRTKDHGHDVYFLTDQASPRCTLWDAINTLKAYDLFGPEHVDFLLQVNMGNAKTRIAPFKGLVHYPKPVKTTQKILVFAEGHLAEEARKAGADIVGGMEIVKQVEDNELEFDHCLSTLDFLPNIKHLPKILRNRMPNIRRGTATDDIAENVKKYRGGETYIADNNGNIRQTLALTSFSHDEIINNIKELLQDVLIHKSTVTNETFFKRASLVIPPGPKIDLIITSIVK